MQTFNFSDQEVQFIRALFAIELDGSINNDLFGIFNTSTLEMVDVLKIVNQLTRGKIIKLDDDATELDWVRNPQEVELIELTKYGQGQWEHYCRQVELEELIEKAKTTTLVMICWCRQNWQTDWTAMELWKKIEKEELVESYIVYGLSFMSLVNEGLIKVRDTNIHSFDSTQQLVSVTHKGFDFLLPN